MRTHNDRHDRYTQDHAEQRRRPPSLGLGVFQSPPPETVGAVEAAMKTGYRLIDTAAAYANEREVGEGIRRSGLSRDDVFLETKIWISDYGYDATLHAFDKSARKLGVDQLDLLLLHQPVPSVFDRTLEAYRALETLLSDGKVRAIGVSNFMPEHLDRLLAKATVVPAVNQIEVHPYFQQAALQRMHKAHGIVTQAWSPIGGITSYRGMEKRSFDDPTLLASNATRRLLPLRPNEIRRFVVRSRCARPQLRKPQPIRSA